MIRILRVLFIISMAIVGFVIAWKLQEVKQPLLGAAAGLICGTIMVLLEKALARRSAREIAALFMGLAIGLFVANIIAFVLIQIPFLYGFKEFIFPFVNIMIGYLGVIIALRRKDEFAFLNVFFNPPKQRSLLLLDTSVIIDGRIADIAERGFLEATYVVPRFILRELQYIADSPDNLKRARGRRGLDILKRLQSFSNIEVRIEDVDLPEKEADLKLVRLAEMRHAKIITNDYNLNKIASIRGVVALNLNELASVLKPIFLPGEEIKIKLVKRGKEIGQAVGYLDDGTMVVVDNGSTKIGREVTCVVTSLLQTSAGRMIFSKAKEE